MTPRLPVDATWFGTRGHLAGGAALIAGVVLAAALVGWGLIGGGEPQATDRRPFEAAVTALATAPALHVRTAFGTAATLDTRTLVGGESTGTLTLGGNQFGFLVLGGRTYVKAPPGILSSLGCGDRTSRWVTGGAASRATAGAPAAGTPVGDGAPAPRRLELRPLDCRRPPGTHRRPRAGSAGRYSARRSLYLAIGALPRAALGTAHPSRFLRVVAASALVALVALVAASAVVAASTVVALVSVR
jgi:hypothetical protein